MSAALFVVIECVFLPDERQRQYMIAIQSGKIDCDD